MAKKKSTEAEATATAEPQGEAAATAAPAKKEKGGPKHEAAVQTAEEPAKKKRKRPGFGPHRGKKLHSQLKNRRQKVAKQGVVSLPQAIDSLKKMKRSKMDETVEVHMNLGVDVTQSDQIVRGAVSLPHGIGKSVRVLVFCQGDNVAKAKEAGADYIGDDEAIQRIQKEGWTDFDVVLATPDMMGKVGRLGKILGPRKLMPSPKAGTVVSGDIAQAVEEFKAGKVEYRTDKTGNLHAGVGKLSFDKEKLVENITTFVEQIRAVKPSGVRGNYIKSIFVSATMSPGIPVSM